MGINKLFERGLALHAGRICLVDPGGSSTYAQVAQRRAALAGALQAAGFENCKCAVLSLNSARALECILGIYRGGGVFVPLNSKNHVSENIYVINQCDVEAVFYDSRLAGDIEAVRAKCPGVRLFVCLDDTIGGDVCLDDWCVGALEPRDLGIDPARLVSIYSTGGTTGRPKGVMFTPLVWEMMAANMMSVIGCAQPPVYLMVSPLTHAAGTFAFPLMAEGATIVIHDHFDARAVLDAIELHRVTHLYLPPTAIYMLLSDPSVRDRDYSSLEAFIYTSAPMSVDKLRQCLDIFGPVMIQFWGQTEAPIFCTCLPPDHHAMDGPESARLASCGQPMLLTEVAVMAEDGRLLPAGERGELVVRGNIVMAGYYKNPEATAEASRFGWHHSGDVGVRDAQGYVYIVDRLKDMIITGGFNVYPSEVEQVIWSHPAVQECAVIGVPDDKWGEAVMAVIELKPGKTIVTDALIAECKAKLGSIKAPKSIAVWDALPRTPVGKVSKKDIRAHFWRGYERSI